TLSPEPGAGYTHQVRVGFYGDRRVVVTMSEAGLNTLKVYDATRLEAPVLLGRWNADPARPHVPQHNIQLLGETLFMAHYTEGLYVFNLTKVVHGPPLAGTLDLRPSAHWAVEEPEPPTELGFANVWEALVIDGVIHVGDITHGLTAIGYGCMPAGDPAFTATL
ncbi:MAG TPA: hypothetical protein VHH36_07170, partial [Candidatus Thermoplasmatota archaeon]|nr:hypothetical protein [Candidatus Thermoplasmatota archaeon]